MLSDKIILLNYDNSNGKPIRYKNWNAIIAIWCNGNIVNSFTCIITDAHGQLYPFDQIPAIVVWKDFFRNPQYFFKKKVWETGKLITKRKYIFSFFFLTRIVEMFKQVVNAKRLSLLPRIF